MDDKNLKGHFKEHLANTVHRNAKIPQSLLKIIFVILKWLPVILDRTVSCDLLVNPVPSLEVPTPVDKPSI